MDAQTTDLVKRTAQASLTYAAMAGVALLIVNLLSKIPLIGIGFSCLYFFGVLGAAFGIGYLVADRGSGGFQARGTPIEMHPPASATPSTARASILIGDRDEVGNWPLLVRASGLKPLPKGQWYELYLTRKGKILAWCGAFNVKEAGRTTVHFSVPYKLKGFDGWVVTNSKRHAKPPVLLTT